MFTMKGKRLFFLDNLKMFIINLMIIFHLAMCYMAYAPDWWYVVDKAHSDLFFTQFILWADVFIMPIMFFVAGYFGMMSLKKHGDSKWWKGRLKRITLPWIVGVALFAAPTTYLTLYSRNVPMDFATFCNTLFFFNPETGGSGVLFSHVQYWYLGILTLLYLGMFLYSKLDKGLLEQVKPSVPGNSLAWGMFLMIFCNIVAMDTITGNDDLWIHLSYFVVLQPCRILLYVLFIFLGAYAWRNQWFSENGYKPSVGKWLPLFLLATLTYPVWAIYGGFVAANPTQFLFIKAFFQAMLLISAFFALLAFFAQFLDGTNKFWGELAANSYTMYYCHMQVVFPVAYFLLPIDLPAAAKCLMACAIGLFLTYCISKLLLFLPCFADSKKAKVS